MAKYALSIALKDNSLIDDRLDKIIDIPVEDLQEIAHIRAFKEHESGGFTGGGPDRFAVFTNGGEASQDASRMRVEMTMITLKYKALEDAMSKMINEYEQEIAHERELTNRLREQLKLLETL